METLVSTVAAVVGLTLFWVGVKKIELGGLRSTILTIADLALAVVAFVQLGWLGLGLFLVLSAIGVAVHSIRLAIQKDSHLVFAATRLGVSKGEAGELFDQIYAEHRVFGYLGPIRTAELVALLADRARDLTEIAAMATPIAMLSAAHNEPDIGSLVEKFDRLLRLSGKSAEDAPYMADVLTKATQISPASFSEVLEAMIASAS